MEKENTHKKKHNFHQSYFLNEYILKNSYHGMVDTDYEISNYIYFCTKNDNYQELTQQLEQEIEILFREDLNDIMKQYPIIFDFNRTDTQFFDFIEHIDFNKLIDDIFEKFYFAPEEKYPVIYKILHHTMNVNRYTNHYYAKEERNKTDLWYTIKNCLSHNINLKKLIKIKKKTEADYFRRLSLYDPKSKSYNDNKNRDWRKKQETSRRRKDRRELKKYCAL